MKRIFTFLAAILISVGMLAQSSELLSYQAVVRDLNQTLLTNQTVGIQISILQGSATGTEVYSEIQTPTTNINGLLSIEIGAGPGFNAIDWANGPYFLKTEIDPTGGTIYTISGTSQLLSVPYALHAKTAETFTGTINETDPVFTAWDKTSGISIFENQILDLNHFTNDDETDPIFTAWDKSTGISIFESQILDLNHFTNADESDPVFTAWDKSTGISIFESQILDLNHFTNADETDPVFTAWDKSTGISIFESQVLDLNHFTNADETDPVFTSSEAFNITATDISNLGNLSGTNSGDQDISINDHDLSISNGSTVTIPDNVDDADADPNNEIELPDQSGQTGKFLSTDGSSPVWITENLDTANMIQDTDGDTKIQVEETANDDMIRFDVAGTEKWVMTASRLEPRNTGGSVFIGEGAGNSDDLSTNHNTAIGHQALYANTTGGQNTANGYGALYNNTTAWTNTANGYQALFSNTDGHSNTAIGNWALYYNTTGDYNTATGNNALYNNTTGYRNTASGSGALGANTTGKENTANGFCALTKNTTGSYNTANGFYALNFNTTGNYNTGIGYIALAYNTTGNYNTGIGYRSGTYGSNFSNTTNVGYFANAGGNNVVQLGNNSITWIGGNVVWSTFSDERIKNQIQEDVKGLDFIMKLRPVTYFVNKDKTDELTGVEDKSDYKEKYDIEKIKQSGFLAQEVEQAAMEAGYDFNGVTSPEKDGRKLYSLSYSSFVMPLVKAVQEQQVIIDQQNEQINKLEENYNALLLRIEKLEK